MFVRVEGLIGWSLRRAFNSEESSQSWRATAGQLMPTLVRFSSRAAYRAAVSKLGRSGTRVNPA